MGQLYDITKSIKNNGVIMTLPKFPTNTFITISYGSLVDLDELLIRVVKTGENYKVYNISEHYITGIKKVYILDRFEMGRLLHYNGKVDDLKPKQIIYDMDTVDRFNQDYLSKSRLSLHAGLRGHINIDIYTFNDFNINYLTIDDVTIRIMTPPENDTIKLTKLLKDEGITSFVRCVKF
jgi:hypothetical protein